MFRSDYEQVSSHAQFYHHRACHDSPTRLLLAPLALWITASVIMLYGCYGEYHMVLGPNSSRLITASSVFVHQIRVEEANRKGEGDLVYLFSEKPELTKELNWTSNADLVVGPFDLKGYSLWLNKGSRIRVRCATRAGRLDKLVFFMAKGERRHEPFLQMPMPTFPFDAFFLNETVTGNVIEYTIEEDDKYYVGVINSNPRSMTMTFDLNVTSRVYDVTKADDTCSMLNGSCRLQLRFPYTQYVVVTTPYNGDLAGGYIELSFVARVVTYIAVLGLVVTLPSLVLKFLGGYGDETTMFGEIAWRTETHPILQQKPAGQPTYGTTEEEDNDVETGDIYNSRLCVICYDEQRNCFFVPCGHCATCYDCAQRVMEEDNKKCPICRGLIHKVRRLLTP